MDGKIIAYLVFLIAVVAGTYGIYYTTEVDDAQRKLATLEAQLETTRNAIKQLGQSLEERKQLSVLQTEQEELEKAILENQTRISATIAEHEQTRAEFEKDIASAREQFVGTSLPEITLVTGTVLKNAKVQRVEETGLAILNDAGVTKVPPSDLPQEMRDRLRFGEEYALPSLGQKPAAPAPVEKPTATAAMSTPARPTLDPEEEARQKRILEGKAAIARLKRELASLEKDLESTTLEANAPATSASRRYYANTRKTALTAQISAVRRQLDAAEVEMTRLGEYVPSR